MEHELLYGPRPVQPVGPSFPPNRGVGHAYPPPRGHPQQQQFHQTNRNLNYPGMRDRQGHQVSTEVVFELNPITMGMGGGCFPPPVVFSK